MYELFEEVFELESRGKNEQTNNKTQEKGQRNATWLTNITNENDRSGAALCLL